MRTRFVVVASAAAAFALPSAAHAGEYFRCEEGFGTSYQIVRPNELRTYVPPESRPPDANGRGYQTLNACQIEDAICSWSNTTKTLTWTREGDIRQFGTQTGLYIRKLVGKEESFLCTPVDKIPYAARMTYDDLVNGQLVTRNVPGDGVTPPLVGATAPPIEAMVFFEWDRASLTGAAIETLDAVVARARTCAHITSARVVGYDDTSQSSEVAMGLSERRASVVRDALVARGIPPSIFQVFGRGDEDLNVATGDGVRNPMNRRVQLTIRCS